MRQILDFSAQRPWWILGLLFLVTAAAVTQVGKVEVRVAADDLLVIDDPERRYAELVKERYGDQKVVLVYLEDAHILDPEKLKAVSGVIDSLEGRGFVERVESLFSVPWLKSVEGYLDKSPYLAEIPQTREEADRILRAALDNTFIRNVLLTDDGKGMGLAVILADGVSGADDKRITRVIEQEIAPLRDHYLRSFAIGFPQIRHEITQSIASEQGDLFPLALLALLVALFAILRKVLDVALPVLTASLSVVWILGLMGWLGIHLNVVTSIVPILMVVVGSTEDIHLLAEFRRGWRKRIEPRRALDNMARKMGRTVLFTFITTFVGFLSVGLSRIDVLWQFGLLAAAGLLLNFLITITLIPAVLALAVRQREAPRGGRRLSGDGENLAQGFWDMLRRGRAPVLLALAAVAALAVAGATRIEVNHNPVDSLAEHSEAKRYIERINQRLSGLETFSVVIDSGIQDTFLKARYLEEVVEIQAFLEEQGVARATTSFADYLALLNAAFQELDEPRLPSSDDIVNELMIFLDYDRVADYVAEDYSEARILVRHNVASTAELRRFVGELQGFIDEQLDSGLEARISGDSVLTLSATNAMIYGQLQSIGLLLLFIVLVISLLFTDLRAGLLAALPNVFPVLVLFGFMGYAEIPLNIGTTMAAAIAIGIAVDDTMHFMLRYNQELKFYKSQSQAVVHTIRGEALPVIATSLALIGGFLVFATSDFEPIRQFGLLSAVVIGAALVADFLLTPLAVSTLRLVTLWDLLSMRVRTEVIGKSCLFRGMSDRQIKRFILSSTLLEFKAGERVFGIGEPSEEVYMVMAGGVEVRVPRRGATDCDMVVDRFSSGQLFGEVAMLAGETRKGNAITLEQTTLLVLNREGIENAVRRYPLIASKLFLNMATDISHRWVRFIKRASNNEICAPAMEDSRDD